MYVRLKIVYENKKSFCIEVASDNEDDFYYQLLTAFKNGECKYNPSEYDQFSISYVEKNNDATLGSERIADLEAENERLRRAGYAIGYHDAMRAAKRGGTLTAEQVMAIAAKHQPDYCSDTHVCFDWQAIADELNAVNWRS